MAQLVAEEITCSHVGIWTGMDGVAMRPSNNLECTIKLGYQLSTRIESFAVINLLIV